MQASMASILGKTISERRVSGSVVRRGGLSILFYPELT